MAASSALHTNTHHINNIGEEEEVIRFHDEDVHKGIKKYTKSLIGRLLVDKHFSTGTLEAALYSIWRQPKGFKVLNHGGNLFQFFFDNETDLLRVINGEPWLLKNYFLNLKRWTVDSPIWHEIRSCSKHLEDIAGDSVVELWGPWLRAEQFGNRIGGENDKSNSKAPGADTGNRAKLTKPTPVSLVKCFASLSMKEPTLRVEGDDSDAQSIYQGDGGNNGVKVVKGDYMHGQPLLIRDNDESTQKQDSEIPSTFNIGCSKGRKVGEESRRKNWKSRSG
ncbi:hypothetical protein PIB30_088761 [Stylosanthes scabra]|uniref:DUF4283 domain-containing protein n=1 Tax=Stylosanthes scabra TaxID=79078 RepID=A0ABU6RUT0_9FABA|nr:hypothetical protein [Stylosanthes scabra]